MRLKDAHFLNSKAVKQLKILRTGDGKFSPLITRKSFLFTVKKTSPNSMILKQTA